MTLIPPSLGHTRPSQMQTVSRNLHRAQTANVTSERRMDHPTRSQPPLDAARIRDLRNAVTRGVYTIDPHAIAGAIIAAPDLVAGDPL